MKLLFHYYIIWLNNFCEGFETLTAYTTITSIYGSPAFVTADLSDETSTAFMELNMAILAAVSMTS